MVIGSILLGLALLILVVLYLAKPIIKAPRHSTAFSDRRHLLEEDKEAYVNEIRALDFDYETGKVPAEVYELQREQLLIDAAAVLKELDDLPAADGDIHAQIEAAVSARRHQHTISGNGQAGFCSQCGQPVDLDDKFCAHCGQPIKIASPTT